MAFQDQVVSGLPLTPENFTAPPLEMGIIPFWFWNGALEEDELAWQMREYHDKGVRSLFLHGRMGLKVPYLSEGWFERVKFVVDKADEVGIDTWIYDEMDWPSGTAGKQVLQEYPHLKQRYLELVALNVDGPLFTFLEAHDDRYVNTGNSHPIAAYGVRRDEYLTGIGEMLDLTKHLSFEKTIPWEAPEGKWVLLYFLEKEVPYYVDVLDPEGTERFLELTHEKYKKAVGHAFGGRVPGFFTDEPAMHYYHVGIDNYVVPWSRRMFKIFRDRRGYDLKPFLPALYANMGAQTPALRYDFWRTLSEQYTETYYKRIRDWCEENGVIFTGHLLFEEMLRQNLRCEGNIFHHLAQMHLIGVDHLYPKIGTEREPGEHVALKLASSAAHHYGSTRLLCESMGGTYWDCTLERMKWMANWEYVLGVNLFNNHGYHYSIEGERKRDWPPSQFYHHTWWGHYGRFTDYMARISHALSGGRHVAKVAMLYPLNSLRAHYVPQQRDPVSTVTEQDFYFLTDALLRLHYDYDYLDEDVLAGAEIEDGKITVRDETFEVLVLPPITHLKKESLEAIRRFVRGGGRLIADTLVPVATFSGEGRTTLEPVEDFFGLDGAALLGAFQRKDFASFGVEHLKTDGKGRVIFIQGRGLFDAAMQGNADFITRDRKGDLDADEPQHVKKAVLRGALEACAPPDVTISDESIFYLHRVKDDLNVYFLVNTTHDARSGVEVTFEATGTPELWNPNTGAITPLHVHRVEAGRLCVTLDFPPSEGLFVVVREGEASSRVTEASFTVTGFDGRTVEGHAPGGHPVEATVEADGRRVRVAAEAQPSLPALVLPETMDFSLAGDNALLIGRWKMAVEEGSGLEEHFHTPDFDDRAWLDVTNGAWEMQLPQERDEDTYPVTIWYRASFEAAYLPDDVRLLIDGFRGSEYRLFLNGEEVYDRGTRSELDAEIMQVGVRSFLNEGRNIVALRLGVTRRTDGLLDLLKLVGDFALEATGDETYRIVPPRRDLRVGDWTTQGLPFFSGTGVYACDLDVPEAYTGGRLFLEADPGEDVLEVRVNGGAEQVAPWHPYRLDVTEHVRPGPNRIELRVTNTLINVLEGKPQASGLFLAPRLVYEPIYRLSVESATPQSAEA